MESMRNPRRAQALREHRCSLKHLGYPGHDLIDEDDERKNWRRRLRSQLMKKGFQDCLKGIFGNDGAER